MAETVRACSAGSGGRTAIQDAFRDGPPEPLASMGAKAGSLLRGAKGFKAERWGSGIDVEFAEGGGGIYEAEAGAES